MYYDFEVPLPDVPGKLAYEKHGDTTYVKYECMMKQLIN